MPEARVQEVQHGVLHTPDIEVHIAPVLLRCGIEGRAVVMRIHEAQVVPARAGPAWHRVSVTAGRSSISGLCAHPFRRPGQRSRAVSSGRIVIHFRQQDRELGVRDPVDSAILRVHDGEGLAPVPLTAKEPVPEAIGDLAPAGPLISQDLNRGGLGLCGCEAVQGAAVHRDPITRKALSVRGA